MKQIRLVTMFAALLVVASSFGNDHNNVDSGRPLRFDDAYSIGFGERVLEFGLGSSWPKLQGQFFEGSFEFKHGFAKNMDYGIALHPSYSSRSKEFDINNIEVSFFRQIQREIDNSPALAYKIELGFPAGRDSKGLEGVVRGILTTRASQYDRFHVNVDLHFATEARVGEREITTGLILGYSNPVGAPTRFNQTFVAQFGFEQSKLSGEGWIGTLGVGMRIQASEKSVFDFGVETDAFSTGNTQTTPFRMRVGYSVSF